MYERRRQAASPVSLLVVTLLSVWACSSGDHGDASVTTSGGAGSEVAAGSAASATTQGVEAQGDGGVTDAGAVTSDDAAGSGGDPAQVGALPVAGSGNAAMAGAGDAAAGAIEVAGDDAGSPGSSGGAPSAGGAKSAGSAGHASGGSGGAPFVPPICTTSDSSTAGLYLPCAVNAALYVCRTCHSDPPTKPASTSYVSFADIKPRAAAIADVVRTGYMPRYPYKLSELQKRTVLTWLGQDGSCAVGVPTACQ